MNQKLITINGETKNMREWSRDPRCKVSYASFTARLNKGLNPLDALTTPGKPGRNPNGLHVRFNITAFGETKNSEEWSRDERCTVKAATIRERVKRGHSAEDAISTPGHVRLTKNTSLLKAKRIELGLGGRELAAILDIDEAQLSRIERSSVVNKVVAYLLENGQ